MCVVLEVKVEVPLYHFKENQKDLNVTNSDMIIFLHFEEKSTNTCN